MSAEALLIILVIGAIAGWLAGQIVKGTGFGLVADIALGIVGAFIGFWLLPRLGFRPGTGFVSAIVAATIGAIVLLVILGFFGRGGGRHFGVSNGTLVLTPPAIATFAISLVLAGLAILAHYADVRFLNLTAAQVFDALAIGYLVLLAGVLVRRI